LQWLKVSNGDENEKINAVKSIYDRVEVKKICEDKMSFFYSKAVANLDSLSVFSVKKQALRKIALELMSRND
jgi:geranylgeranyl diphosphate synthase type II